MHFCASPLANVFGGPACGQPSICLCRYLSRVGFAKSWEEGGLCVLHLLMDQWAPVPAGHLHPFKSHLVSFSLSPMAFTLEGLYLLHSYRAGGKFLRVDWVSVPRDVLEQLLGNWRIPSCLSCNSGMVISRSCSSSST